MIVKARNYSKLTEAINDAKDEEMFKKTSSQQVFHMRGRGNFNRGFVKCGSRGNSFGSREFRSNFHNNRNYQHNFSRGGSVNLNNSNNNNRNQGQYHGSNRGNFRGNFRGSNSNRGNNNRNGNQRSYQMQEDDGGLYKPEPSSSGSQRFFRSS